MEKGQITLDLLLIFVVVLLVISGMGVLLADFKSNQEKMLVIEQLNSISTKTASVITSSQALIDTNFRIEMKIDRINYADANGNYKSTRPRLFIDSNLLVLRLEMPNNGSVEVLDANARFYKDANTILDTSGVQSNGTLVIRNA